QQQQKRLQDQAVREKKERNEVFSS
ncbi:hypothetical protein ICU_04811, partial [Bacillus cereus BAG2X1-1]